jgi:hypothetical protein
MDQAVRHLLRARAQGKRRDQLVAGLERRPEPAHPLAWAQAGTDLVQLHMGQVQIVQEVVVDTLGLLGGTVAPAGNGGFAMTEGAYGGADLQALRQSAEHLADAGGRSLELLQCGAPASADLGAAGLTAKHLDAIGAALAASGDEACVCASVLW